MGPRPVWVLKPMKGANKMTITYTREAVGVDWTAMRQALIDDDFHNGRSVTQYRVSFENSHAVVIAYDGAQIVGTARVLSDGVCNAYIVDVWTHSSYRGRGIARVMMQMLEDSVPGQHVSLWTESAQGFYEKLGYKRTANTLYEKVAGEWLRGE